MKSVSVPDTVSEDLAKLNIREREWIYRATVLGQGSAVSVAMTVAAPGAEVIYRVLLKGERANVVCIDMPIDYLSEAVCREYDRFEQAPQWLQDRVLALRMLTEGPPTGWVDGVGRRVSEDVFWVVK